MSCSEQCCKMNEVVLGLLMLVQVWLSQVRSVKLSSLGLVRLDNVQLGQVNLDQARLAWLSEDGIRLKQKKIATLFLFAAFDTIIF